MAIQELHYPSWVPSEYKSYIASYLKFFNEFYSRMQANSASRLSNKNAQYHKEAVANLLSFSSKLLGDERTRTAFQYLRAEFSTPKEWHIFFEAARHAKKDYKSIRESYSRSVKAHAEIATAADTLIRLLINNVSGAAVIWSLGLGKHIDSHAADEPWAEICKAMRLREKLDPLPEPLAILARNSHPLFMIPWLRHLSNYCRDCDPLSSDPCVSAALSRRQHNSKTEYLRAFEFLLSESKYVNISSNVIHAIAIISTIVLDDPNVDVSYDDVRKTLARRMARPPQGKSRKTRGHS